MPRPSRGETFMDMAWVLARRSRCERLQVGAIVTDAAGLQILGMGYNGAPASLPNGCAAPLLPGECGCVHAEANAIIKAPGALPGKILYTTHTPCERCAQLIVNGGITQVFFDTIYRDARGYDLLLRAGIAPKQVHRPL